MMETSFIYLIKSSVILTIFLIAYSFLLKRETIFGFNRIFLFCGLLVSILLPAVWIPEYIEVTPVISSPAEISNTVLSTSVTEPAIPLWDLVLCVYLTGLLYFGLKLVWEYGALVRYIKKNKMVLRNGYRHLICNDPVAPFSFFNWIAYNPDQYSEEELDHILAHEEVHARQWHSADIILSRLYTIVFWFNPLSWVYSEQIRENLEFIADDLASKLTASMKSYQYTLLKASGYTLSPVLTNTFYSSLIKKRIVMLHRSKSKRTNALKSLLILPILAVFLISFNTREVYVTNPENPATAEIIETVEKRIELKIDKDTSEEELAKMKSDLATKGFDFSYTVVRNENKEIIELSVHVSSSGDKDRQYSGSSSFSNDGEPIDGVHILIDDEAGTIFIGSGKAHFRHMHGKKGDMTWIHSGDSDEEVQTINIIDHDGKEKIIINGKETSWEELQSLEGLEDDGRHVKVIRKKIEKNGDSSGDRNVFIFDADKDAEEMEVEIEEKDGREVIRINGKEVTRAEYESMKDLEKDKKIVKIHKIKDGKKDGKKFSRQIMVISDEEDQVIQLDESDEEEFSFLFLGSDADEDRLYIVDGKETSAKKARKIRSEDIATINVMKGEPAIEKYGEKARNGVVVITTKKQ